MPRLVLRPELADARDQGFHNIGEAAELTGVTAKMIRHYESIGLIPPANRTFANYRLYNDADLHRLRFIKRSRTLGFSMKQIEALLGRIAEQESDRRAVALVADEREQENKSLRAKLTRLEKRLSAIEALFKAHPLTPEFLADLDRLNKEH